MLKKMEEQQAGKRGEISQQQTEKDGGGAQLKKSVVGNAEVESGGSWYKREGYFNVWNEYR